MISETAQGPCNSLFKSNTRCTKALVLTAERLLFKIVQAGRHSGMRYVWCHCWISSFIIPLGDSFILLSVPCCAIVQCDDMSVAVGRWLVQTKA